MTEASDHQAEVIARRRRLLEVKQGADWKQGLVSGEDRGHRAPTRSLPGHGEAWSERHWSSRTLHRFGEASAHSGAGLTAAVAVLIWLGVGFATGFPHWWETALYSCSAVVTLIMVFSIQHTQTREQSATQRKLDELLRAQPGADNTLIAVEEASDQELSARATLNLADRSAERPGEERPGEAASGEERPGG